MTALNAPWTRRANSVSSLREDARVDAPAPGEHRCRTDDQQRPQTALEAYRDDAWRTVTNLRRTGRLKQVLDRAPDHAVGERQGDDDQNEPEARHGSRHPERPQQHDADRQQRVLCAPAETMRLG